MKTYLSVAALSLVSALTWSGTSHAGTAYRAVGASAAGVSGEATYVMPPAANSLRSRAEVRAEAVQARVAGLQVIGEKGSPEAPFAAQRSRAEVLAETRAAVRSGELEALNREPYGSGIGFQATRTAPTPSMTTASR